ncbi:hypothetical protein C8Q74DRAFT_1368240 [Fomes fomentarius]|nr:hypothetical protein C8Q74DRAFT_1368240 [Fomes fomentarius]
MSNPSPVNIAFLINSIVSGRAANYLSFAITSMMVYDYTLTFSSEVDMFWKRKFGLASALFYFNRYFLLFVCISQTAFFWDALVLWHATNFDQALHNLQYIPYAVFCGLRSYALTERRALLSATVFILALAPFLTNTIRFLWLTYAIDPIWGCEASLDIPASFVPRCMLSTFIVIFLASHTALATVSYATRISVILADGIVVGFIGHAIYKLKKVSQGLPASPSCITLLFRDGSMLFMFVHCNRFVDAYLDTIFTMSSVQLVLGTLQLTLTGIQLNTSNTGGVAQVTSFITPITAVLTTRSLLNLQQLNRSITQTTLTDISFYTQCDSEVDFASRTDADTCDIEQIIR